MIEFQNLSIGNRRPLVRNQNLNIAAGTLTALVGRNGCGKSTLLRVMAGTQKPIEGKVIIDSDEVTRLTPADLATKVAVITTEPVKVNRLTCRELVAMGRAPHTGIFGRLSDADNRIIDKSLAMTGMSDFANRYVAEVSDGESRRIMLARALAQDAPVILLDEPTSFLDVPGRFEIGLLLHDLTRSSGKTIVYSTHELEPAMRFADSLLFMNAKGLTLLPPEQMRNLSAFRETMQPDLHAQSAGQRNP